MKSKSFNDCPSITEISKCDYDTRYFEERRKTVVVNGCITSQSELVEVSDEDRFAGQSIDDYMLSNLIECGALDEKVVKPLLPSSLKIFDSVVDFSEEFKD